jgi:nitrogen regulatory protein P-II 1
MKMVTAIIQENKLDAVREELINEEVYRLTVGRVSGRGQQVAEDQIYRGQRITPNLIPKIRVDIAVNEDFVERAVRAILKGARANGSGEVGDGKIFVTPLERCIRIRTSEEGSEAI